MAALGAVLGFAVSAGGAWGLEPCGPRTRTMYFTTASVVADGDAYAYDDLTGEWVSDAGTSLRVNLDSASSLAEDAVFNPPECQTDAPRLLVDVTDPFTGLSGMSMFEVQP